MINFKSDINKYLKYNDKKKIYISLIFAIVVIGIVIIGMQLLKYNVEGEKSLPFKLTKMLIISTADGIGKEDSQYLWDLDILQKNDVYIEIKENKEDIKNDQFKKITLENFIISNGPQKGEPKIYHPVNDKDLVYVYKEENISNEKIEYNVAEKSNIKKLEISSNEGLVSFSSCSSNVASYKSNEDTEVSYDGKLLNKVQITEEEVKYDVSFDMIIEMESKKTYKATFNLQLPLKNITSDGIVKSEIKDFENIVFKRI